MLLLLEQVWVERQLGAAASSSAEIAADDRGDRYLPGIVLVVNCNLQCDQLTGTADPLQHDSVFSFYFDAMLDELEGSVQPNLL
jgi:hypothetical protein